MIRIMSVMNKTVSFCVINREMSDAKKRLSIFRCLLPMVRTLTLIMQDLSRCQQMESRNANHARNRDNKCYRKQAKTTVQRFRNGGFGDDEDARLVWL